VLVGAVLEDAAAAPAAGAATGAVVEPKLGTELGAAAPDVARELFEAFPNEEDPRSEAGVDELFSFEGFPNTKGAGAPAGAEGSPELPPNGRDGAPGVLPLPFAVEVPKLKPL